MKTQTTNLKNLKTKKISERNPMLALENDNNAYDVGSPKNLGPFDTVDLAIKELEDFAKDKQFSVRILSSNYDKKTNEKKNATVTCIHFGKPVLKKYVPKSDQLAHSNTESQRCDCKFEAYIGRAKNGSCSIKMKNTKHNHSFSEDQSAQLSNKKLTSDQIKLIAELHKAGSTPTSIREALVQQNPGQMITQKSVYNAIARAKMVELNGLTPIQFLIEQLDEKTYKFEMVTMVEYHTSLVMDATYKTNRFGLPLVQFIDQMKKYCFSKHVPVSISTDRDLSLLNALKTKLPEVKHLLCRWHISKKVLSHIPKVFNGLEKDSVDSILVNWNRVVSSHTQQDYANNLAALIKGLYLSGQICLPILEQPLPQEFRAHAVLKRHLTSSTGDLSTVFNKMDTVLRRQYTDIMVRSQQQQYKQNNQIRAPLFDGLTKKISKHALHMAFKKYGEARLDKLTTNPKSKLKPCDLSTVFDKMDTVLRRQYTDIMVRSQQQQYKQNNQIRAPLFDGLTKKISKHALQMAFKKYGEARLDKLTTDPKSKLKPYKGSFTKTLGIPCAHMIKGKLINSDNTMILKGDFHEQ
ncbi:hypothetical protein [Parasitella parasitica]|uniref:MULE transposase domain-containing protein n=1 Tax=Parasitella parasitica TaxID=35722 RepID=A0A0B7NEW5_9FUNG|nr:hypothetical protein [Parasitella parasitica]